MVEAVVGACFVDTVGDCGGHSGATVIIVLLVVQVIMLVLLYWYYWWLCDEVLTVMVALEAIVHVVVALALAEAIGFCSI